MQCTSVRHILLSEQFYSCVLLSGYSAVSLQKIVRNQGWAKILVQLDCSTFLLGEKSGMWTVGSI